jgi:EF-P beta-lysylation protein EpmB
MSDPPALPDWKQSLAQAVRDPDTLLRQLDLADRPGLLARARRAARLFPLRAPQSYIRRMRRADPADPLLRQVLPLGRELEKVAGFTGDPVGDLRAMVTPGLLHKYPGRALLVATGACAIHCRYCFRREFPYAEAGARQPQWRAAMDYLKNDPSIKELILSGGDPLTLTNPILEQLIDYCEAIPHLKRLRIHSRLPVVLPERIEPGLCRLFERTRLQVIHVIHANHPREIDRTVGEAVGRLGAGAGMVLNQAVMLKDINDSADTQKALCEALVDIGIVPYYLHQLDPVAGAHHFEVDDAGALSIMSELQNSLPGYMVPKLVREHAGEPSKTPLGMRAAGDSGAADPEPASGEVAGY